MDISRTIEIDAPPEIVWEVWSDVERWPEWTAGVTQVEVLPDGDSVDEASVDGESLAVGRRVRIRQPKFPTAVWSVTSVEPGRLFEWVSSSPGARVTGRHKVEPRADGGSTATMSLKFEGLIAKLVARVSRSLTNHYIELEAAGLKKVSEARAAV